MNAELEKWLNDNSETLFERGSYGESGDSVSAVRLSSLCDLFAGKVLVPVEPTDAMLDAAADACAGKMYPQDMTYGPRAMMRDRYKAMLAASQDVSQ
jgi:hypothetical protein